MPEFISGLGKGLREPCSPYREAYYFGAELNEPNADNWNCPPRIVTPTTSFDLSSISEGKEVLVALLGVGRTVPGTYYFTFRWYRDRDDALLFEFTIDFTAGRDWWCYAYSYIGWVPWEINENGGYVVEIDVSGPERFSKKIPFTISGIPEEEPAPPPVGGFLPTIIYYILEVASFFLDLKHKIEDWIWPFYLAAPAFLWIADAFARMAHQFELFNNWVSNVTGIVVDILNLSEIIKALKTWLDYATWAWNWVRDAWTNVRAIVVPWWGTVIPTVYGWIEAAKQWASEQIDSLEKLVYSILADVDELLAQIPDVSELIAWFSNWWGNILVNLSTWWDKQLLEVQRLIDTAFRLREGFWEGWQDIRGKVFEFFDDPLEWLLERFTNWFLGPEE